VLTFNEELTELSGFGFEGETGVSQKRK